VLTEEQLLNGSSYPAWKAKMKTILMYEEVWETVSVKKVEGLDQDQE
jgi:hypothetical protein